MTPATSTSTAVLVIGGGATAIQLARLARRRGHVVRELDCLDQVDRVTDTLRGAGAVVLIPRRGDPQSHAHAAAATLIDAAHHQSADPHLVLVSSFAVGHGPSHPFNRVTGSYAARLAAEHAVRASRLPWTVVRPTWLTDDPPGAHAVTLTQDPTADGMISCADVAIALVHAVEQPAARTRTFALYNEPGPAPHDWPALFAALEPDPITS